MTIDTKRLRELHDEWRVNAPHETVEEANDLLCAVPELIDEVERLRSALAYLRRKIDGYDTTFYFAIRDERGETPIPGFEDWKAAE